MVRRVARLLVWVIAASLPSAQAAQVPTPAVEFFEREVRPLLIEKCQTCHNDKKRRGGLSLTSRELALVGGDSGPALVPGKPAESRLMRMIEYHGDLKMPPTGKLRDTDIARFRLWIAQGAPWPDSATGGKPAEKFQISDKQRRWWAFQRPGSIALPVLTNAHWARSPIDLFILGGLRKHGLTPSEPATRHVLIRRVTFDLTGLPPTPEEVDAFVRDTSPDAFARVVDRLLASQGYGQRWARHWLDIVRYADYHDGNPAARTASCEPLNAWRYRDWVVRAFNSDLPFDRFILYQIAGDRLMDPDGAEFFADGLIATTFLTNGTWDRGDADKDKILSDMVDDQIDTIGKVFLGLTFGCARCHDHKFDPISQRDYYALAGIFYSTRILQELGAKGGEYTLQRVPLVPQTYLKQRGDQLQQLATLGKQLAALEKKSGSTDPGRLDLLKKRDSLKATLLPEPPVAEAAQDGGMPGGLFPKIQDVPLHIRGSFTRLGPTVPRRFPQFLAGATQPRIEKGSGRPELARWIASRDNPLTARVIVNRVWQWHFGTGIVPTPNNFGLQSEPPSHPELLDWLATQFVAEGWSLKQLHRHILLSATYQQASTTSREQRERDEDNRWFGRFTPRRLEAEAIRDAMLFVAGQLDRTPNGPATADLLTNRRSLYVQTARWDRNSYAALFDAANPDASVERRTVSTIAPQALFLLNHDFARIQARNLAERLTREVPTDSQVRMDRAYRLLFGRAIRAEEVAVLRKLLARSDWRDLAHVLLCCNEFAYLD